MSGMSELAIAVAELKRCGDALVGVSESLAGLFNDREDTRSEEKTNVEAPAQAAKPVSLEEVRAVLAEKSRDGLTAQVRALLERHGATKLSEIDPGEYPALLAEAEALGNG